MYLTMRILDRGRHVVVTGVTLLGWAIALVLLVAAYWPQFERALERLLVK